MDKLENSMFIVFTSVGRLTRVDNVTQCEGPDHFRQTLVHNVKSHRIVAVRKVCRVRVQPEDASGQQANGQAPHRHIENLKIVCLKLNKFVKET